MDEQPGETCETPAARVVVSRQEFATQDLDVIFRTEDLRRPASWQLREPHHTLVVHLSGSLQRMETVFSRGPSSAVLPSIGDIWAIPAGCECSLLMQGDRMRLAEFRVPIDMLGGGELAPRVGHRDPFFHRATERAALLASRDDGSGETALVSLLEALRHHIADAFLGSTRRPGEASASRQRFSERQKKRLVDHVANSMHEPMDANDLAAVAGVSVSRLVEGFKASFGITPWQYVLRARLAEARRLLESGDASVTAISAATGFSSPSHLATSFGKHFGLSPAAYRREPHGAAAGVIDTHSASG